MILSLASAIYPLLWYYGHQHGGFIWLALGMALLWLLRTATSPAGNQRWLGAVLSCFFIIICICNRPEAMYWYPVAVSLFMLVLFGGSLFSRQSIIERLAHLTDPDLPPSGVRYTRRVTQIWCVFFIFNSILTSLLVLTASWQAWALYSGVISYLLMGLLLGAEWLFRRYILVRRIN